MATIKITSLVNNIQIEKSDEGVLLLPKGQVATQAMGSSINVMWSNRIVFIINLTIDTLIINDVTILVSTTTALLTVLDGVFLKANSSSGGTGTATTDASLLVTGVLSDSRLSSNVPLMIGSKIQSANLPAYVDDVLEFVNLAALPVTGVAGVIYITLDTNLEYRWAGSSYINIAKGDVQSVAGRTGAVVLSKADVTGIDQVTNTSDANKPVSTAQATAIATKEPILTLGTSAQYYRGDKTLQTLNAAAVGIGYSASAEVNNSDYITAWGDSLTFGFGITTPYTTALEGLVGYSVRNRGVTSQTSTQIATRQGSVAALATVVGGSIPASGTVVVTFPTGFEPVRSTTIDNVYGTISGVYGFLQYTTTGSGTIVFTRSTAGTAVSVTSANFIPDISNSNAGATIIWIGRNNYTSPTQVKSDIAAIVASITSGRYLVIGITTSNVSAEWIGQTAYTALLQLNTDLAALYGTRFLDIRPLLVAQYNPSIPQDVTDHNNDAIPTSLLNDVTHMNNAGYAYIASQIMTKLSSLQKTNPSALTTNNVPDIFAYPSILGGVTQNKAYVTRLGIGTTTPIQPLDIQGTSVSSVQLFSGAGTNNAIFSGTYNGKDTQTLRVQIDGAGTPDTFKFSLDGGTTFSTSTIAITGSAQLLANGISVIFATTTGHTLTNYWQTVLTPAVGNINVTGSLYVAGSVFAAHFNTNCTAVGIGALGALNSGLLNTAIGFHSSYVNKTGNNNTSVGANSLTANISGSQNVSVGQQSLNQMTSGGQNVSIGVNSGASITIGGTNTFLGYQAGFNGSQSVGASNSTCLGANSYSTANNQMVFGDTQITQNVFTGKMGIGLTNAVSATASLHIKAGVAIGSGAPIKLTPTAAVLLTTPELGAIEADTTNLYYTRVGTTRESVLTSAAANAISPTAPNRTITIVIGGTTYYLAAKTTND